MSGGAQMIGLNIEFDGKALASLEQLSKQFPKEMKRAMGFVATNVKRKFRAEMRKGGGKDIPPFAPPSALSSFLRPGKGLGGKLAEPATIVSYKRGDVQVVGWVDGLEGYGSMLQSAQSRETTTEERHYLHRRRVGDVPSWYSRPARPVSEPLARAVAPEFPRWFESSATKLIEKSLKKAGF